MTTERRINELQTIIAATTGSVVDLTKDIELSVEWRVYSALQLDCDECLEVYSLTPTRPNAKRAYYRAPVKGWLRVIIDLYDRADGYDPDCSVPRSATERLQKRLEKALTNTSGLK